jgi:hypothetical protein
MTTDYLWNPEDAPDADVEALERALQPLRFASRAQPLALPARSPVRAPPLRFASGRRACSSRCWEGARSGGGERPGPRGGHGR